MDYEQSGNEELRWILGWVFQWDDRMIDELEGCTAEERTLADSSTAVILTIPANGKPGGDFTETVLIDGKNMLWKGDFGTFTFESACPNNWLTLPFDRPVLIENRLLPMPDRKFDGRWNTVRFLIGLRQMRWYQRLDDEQKARLAELLNGDNSEISPDDILYPERETCEFLIGFIKSTASPQEWNQFFDDIKENDRKHLYEFTYMDDFQTYEGAWIYQDGFWAVLYMLKTAAEARRNRA